MIGHGRAAELLFTGRAMSAEEGLAWGFFNRVSSRAARPRSRRRSPAPSPTARPSPIRMTKSMLDRNGRCASTRRSKWKRRRRPSAWRPSDFTRAYDAFATKQKPVFTWRLDLDWPFYEQRHRDLAGSLGTWAKANLAAHGGDVDAECRDLVAKLGAAGFLHLCVGDGAAPDVRSLAIAARDVGLSPGLADFAFAMQGLGSGAISLAGSPAQRAQYLPKVAPGEAIAAFAMTEPATAATPPTSP